ncbi:MAG TPA: hypothetical protein VIV57_04695 [Anaeromyxobacter sp.]
MGARLVLSLLLAGASAAASAQTMLDQERHLIDIHSLLLDLPPLEAPGALPPGRLSVGLEAVTIPRIDGTTGTKRQITASDRTPLFPRPRLALGLPAPEGFRAMVGASYIPPVAIRDVSTHYGAAEAAMAWTPGPLRAGLRGHLLYATSRSPVTEPATRDALETWEYGADLSAGWSVSLPPATLEPYAALGVVHLRGRFRVTSDGYVLRSQYTGAALDAGLRFVFRDRWEGVAEVEAYPGRLVHTNFRAGYLFH